MSDLADLIPKANSPSPTDKLRLIQLLAEELAVDEGGGIQANQSYVTWSPDRAFDAADIMLRTLVANEAHL